MLGGYVGKTICHCILGAYMWYENKRRNRVYGEPDPVIAADNGMKGMTEIESESRIVASFYTVILTGALTCINVPADIHFRYVL
jgi:hypothetical protein